MLQARLGNGLDARTKNISATGALLELEGDASLGSRVDLEIRLEAPGGPLRLVAQGRVVRVQPSGTRQAIAVQFVTSHLEQEVSFFNPPAGGYDHE